MTMMEAEEREGWVGPSQMKWAGRNLPGRGSKHSEGGWSAGFNEKEIRRPSLSPHV